MNFNIDEDRYEALKTYCDIHGISISFLMRKLVEQLLPREVVVKKLPDDWVFGDFQE